MVASRRPLPRRTHPWRQSICSSYVCFLRIDEFAAWKRNEHGRMLTIAPILLAKLLDQIALLQLDTDQDVGGDRDRKKQMTDGHRGRRPHGEQDAEINRVTHMPVEQRSAELRVRRLFAEQASKHLAQPEQLEMTEQKRAAHQYDPSEPEDAFEDPRGGGVVHDPN